MRFVWAHWTIEMYAAMPCAPMESRQIPPTMKLARAQYMTGLQRPLTSRAAGKSRTTCGLMNIATAIATPAGAHRSRCRNRQARARHRIAIGSVWPSQNE